MSSSNIVRATGKGSGRISALILIGILATTVVVGLFVSQDFRHYFWLMPSLSATQIGFQRGFAAACKPADSRRILRSLVNFSLIAGFVSGAALYLWGSKGHPEWGIGAVVITMCFSTLTFLVGKEIMRQPQNPEADSNSELK